MYSVLMTETATATTIDCNTCYDTETIDHAGSEISCPDCATAPARPTAPTFSTAGQPKGTYNVKWGDDVLGTVAKNVHGVWVTTHRDGTAGPGAWTRIDAAWALLNS